MSFINPIFLIALGTAALPILYHLVRRIQAKQVVFSSLMFLKMTPQEVVRRRRIQHWLLMVMRCILLGLLALAFSRPFIPKDQIPFISSRENQSVVLLIDNSYSMQYEAEGPRSLLDEARDAAIAKLDEAAGEDEFSVVIFSDEPRQITPLDEDVALHRNAIQNTLAASYRPTDFYKPMRLAEEILAEAAHTTRRVVLISDIQQTGWQGAFENWKLNRSIDFEIIQVGNADRENNFVDAFSLSERRVEGSVVHRFNARIADGGEGTLSINEVNLIIEGAQVDEQRVGGDEVQRASFQYRAPREGTFLGQVTLDDDRLLADNVRYFTFTVDNRPALLGIGGGARDITRASYYLDRAFNQGDRALYRFNAAPSDRLSNGLLNDQQLVFFSAISANSQELETLKRYVEDGGNIVVSFEDQVDIAAYGDLFTLFGIGQIDEIIRARTEQGYDAIIGEVDERHPIFTVFAESGTGAIFRPRFRQYARVRTDSSASVFGRYDSGDPFLIEKEFGKGRVLVYTSSLSPAWTDFTINEMFVPFLYQVAKYALSARSIRSEYLVGEMVRLEGTPGSEWDVRAPGNALYKVPIDENGQGFFLETELPGHYTAASGGNQLVFAVNVDPEESLLASRDREEAYGAVVPPPDDVPLTIEEARLMELDDEERQQKFWRYVILCMVLLYALETFIANRKNKK